MKVYFNLRGNWLLLNNDTDFINGYTVQKFVDKLTDTKTKDGFNYKLDNFIVRIVYNQINYCTDFSNLLFENIN